MRMSSHSGVPCREGAVFEPAPRDKSGCHLVFELIHPTETVLLPFPIKWSLSPSTSLRAGLALMTVLAMTIGCVDAAPSVNVGWDVAKVGGREYVSVDSIRRFYNFTKMTRTGGSVILENAKVEMNLKIGGNECLMNNVKFVLSESIATVGEKIYVSRVDLAKLIDPVLRPHFIQNAGDFRTVVLDPGHGGKDPGATNPYGTEADYNVKVAGLAKKQLEAKGFKVVMTRSTDIYQSLQERVDLLEVIASDIGPLALRRTKPEHRKIRIRKWQIQFRFPYHRLADEPRPGPLPLGDHRRLIHHR